MEKVDLMYDNMSGIYSDLEGIMESIYRDIQADPMNEKNKELLKEIGNVALKVLTSQRELVENYGDTDIKTSLMSNIDSRSTALTTAVEKSCNVRTR